MPWNSSTDRTAELARSLQRLARAHRSPEEADEGRFAEPITKRRPSEEMELNVIPLIDVLFLLMIFFVIGGTFQASEGVLISRMFQSQRGVGGASTLPPMPLSPIVLEFTAQAGNPGDYLVRVRGSERGLKNVEGLAVEMQRLMESDAFDADTPVVLACDDVILWEIVAEGWNAVLRAGFRDVAFGYLRTSRAPSQP